MQNWRPVGASRSCGSYCLGFALLKKRLWSPVFQYGPVPYWQQWLPMASIGIVRERSLHNWKTMQLQVSCCWRERTCQAILKGRNADDLRELNRRSPLDVLCILWSCSTKSSYIWFWSQWENKSLICTLCSPLLTSVARPSESPAVAAPYCGVQWAARLDRSNLGFMKTNDCWSTMNSRLQALPTPK